MQPLQNCIGPTIRINREIRCLPYAVFFNLPTRCTIVLDIIMLRTQFNKLNFLFNKKKMQITTGKGYLYAKRRLHALANAKKNIAYGKQRISRPMRILGPIQFREVA